MWEIEGIIFTVLSRPVDAYIVDAKQDFQGFMTDSGLSAKCAFDTSNVI